MFQHRTTRRRRIKSNGQSPRTARYRFLPQMQLLRAMYRWNQHSKRIPVRRLPSEIRPRRLGKRPLQHTESKSFRLHRLRQMRAKMPVPSADPRETQEVRAGYGRINLFFTEENQGRYTNVQRYCKSKQKLQRL